MLTVIDPGIAKHAQALRNALARYIDAGRPSTPPVPAARTRSRPAPGAVSTTEVRDWGN